MVNEPDNHDGKTSVDVRDELEDRLERDLHGPWDGPEEELLPGVLPAERYLLGRLVPFEPAPTLPRDDVDEPAVEPSGHGDPSATDMSEPCTGDLDDNETPPEAVVRSGSRAASSMGMSFSVPRNVDTVTVTASWGRYNRVASEIHQTEQGRPRRVWKREPCGGSIDIDVSTVGDESGSPDPRFDQVVLKWTIRHRGQRRIIDIALVNTQHIPDSAIDSARLYQVSLTATAPDGHTPIFLGHNDPDLPENTADQFDDERRALELQYRERREYALGRQCAVTADVDDGEPRARRLTTTCFPKAEVPLVVPGAADAMPGLILDMARLGSPDLARDDLIRALRPLVRGYRTWLDDQERRLGDPEISRYAPAGENAIAAARLVSDRLERAIELLAHDGLAREAFRFANQAMALQRVRGEVSRRRAVEPDLELDALLREYEIPQQRSWRPFQLAFVLLCLPGLTDPTHQDAYRGQDDGQVQLLFFPTGGGKTEAYLGLTAYTLAIRRLQGVVGSGAEARDGTDGVAVLMRYTLRLLTAQQFQRAAALICACEWLRRERIAGGDSRWSTTPFRLGLWVGLSVTPNTFESAKAEIEDKKGYDAEVGGVLQLVACPWCGLQLSPGRDMSADDRRRRILVYCPDPEGGCPFSRRESPDEGLPVLTVDEEVYRLTPALVIGTVDKFAQLPWRAATATLFGLVDARCARHGWQNPDFAGFCKSKHPAVGDYPAVGPVPAMRLRPPDLVIQDELHLISDALGSMVGLYETVIDDLCSRPYAGMRIRPVLVASTATVRRAADQAEQVFARGLTIFPPQVLDAGETYFSTTTTPSPENPARRYRGICAPGESLKAVEIRVMSAVLEHGQYLYDKYREPADPYMTVADYFTSTRELAGMHRLVDDDVAERLVSLKVITRRRRPAQQELTSRMPSARITSTLSALDRSFDYRFDSTDALDRLRADKSLAAKFKDWIRPIDVLLATSMLQVGVDVPRLGLMLVTGQPKNTAEYIQATSRVGRDRVRPGLVLTILQWSRPRDLGHFETFVYGHQTFGARVEGVTTTPFSDRALDRALAAVVVSAVRHSSISALSNDAAHSVPLDGPIATALIELLEARAEKVTHSKWTTEEVGRRTRSLLDKWAKRRKELPAGILGYTQAPDVAALLVEPGTGRWESFTSPTSMREIENAVLLQLQAVDISVMDAPAWEYAPGAQP
ncbi:DISARM system helicase DrmA [Nocardia pseudobrasiliensis]|uniref:Helicase-like protein n=1 Tax=Nocardia pseudobrasiliensis TaxID=45979 RepID=A0A370HPM5_9NOCA|nr:DISARM system helicase DrmA [Nocardia pseudobrasiliensis]RDI60280.1 helicase-like protein [Nocardia pseudobrasiliensis]